MGKVGPFLVYEHGPVSFATADGEWAAVIPFFANVGLRGCAEPVKGLCGTDNRNTYLLNTSTYPAMPNDSCSNYPSDIFSYSQTGKRVEWVTGFYLNNRLT